MDRGRRYAEGVTDAELDKLERQAHAAIAADDRGPFEEVLRLIAEVRRLRLLRVDTGIIPYKGRPPEWRTGEELTRLEAAERVAERLDRDRPLLCGPASDELEALLEAWRNAR